MDGNGQPQQGGQQGADVWVSSSTAYRTAKQEAEERDRERARRVTASSQSSLHRNATSGLVYAAPLPTNAMLVPVYIEQPQQTVVLQPVPPSKRDLNRRYTAILLNIIAVCHAVLFVIAVLLNNWSLTDLKDNPLLGPGVEALLKIGATAGYNMSQGHQYWRLLVSPFLGAGVLHVVANMSAILTFGLFLSNELSTWQIGLLYITCGLSAVTTSANIGDTFVTAAGSGPALGFIGAACALLLMRFRRLRNHLLSWALVAFSLALHFFIGATPFVDNSGNTAGFVAGLLMGCGMLLIQWTPGSRRREVAVRILTIVLLSIAMLLPVIGIIGLNGGLPLGGCCDPWVCAPSSWWNCGAAQLWPNSCGFSVFPNGTMTINCPQGQAYIIPPALINYGNTTSEVMDSVCQSYCTVSGSSPAMGPSGGINGTAGSGPLGNTS